MGILQDRGTSAVNARSFFIIIIINCCLATTAGAQTTTFCDSWGSSVVCRTSKPQPPQKSGLEKLNEELARIAKERDERKLREQQEQLYQLQLQQAEEQRRKIEEEQRFLRQQADLAVQKKQEEEARRMYFEQVNAQVSRAVLENRCEDAKNIALGAGNFDLAERALRLCKTQPPVSSSSKLRNQAAVPNSSTKLKPAATAVLPPRPAKSVYVPPSQKELEDQKYVAQKGRAFDLNGSYGLAQQSYHAVLATGPNDEVRRSLAISYALAGDARNMEYTIAPLLVEGDKRSHRAYAFALAILGRVVEANAVAKRSAPADITDAISAYLIYFNRLSNSQKAHAAHFGLFPRWNYIGSQDGKWASDPDVEFTRVYLAWVS